ncbi:hypothetical protein DINM_021728 [Dirofilaria immitis]|nr:hypothetical protein [Dirofilaria immitis]
MTIGASSTGSRGQPLCGLAGGSKSEIKHRFEITKNLDQVHMVKYRLLTTIKLNARFGKDSKEIRIMSALKHPNIIQIFEVFENRDKIILVMEYASGGELYDYVSTFGSLPEPEARRIFRQITSAILYCHKHKVAHRDLKLENILLDADNNAKIADFGLSNYFSDKTLLNTFCGSPLYASPEIINGTPYRGPEVDCWSLGILLYTLVYGSMPFDGRDFNRMVRQIKRGAYFEPDTPSTASMLIRNMLRVNPERRADIDEIASHWWLNLDENMPVIQELPENQIIDHTPLTDRAETMVVQDLADEADVFMDFGHLSPSTRLKIEEFRRRRKEAEEYIENSPIKPPKARKTDGTELPTLTAAEKAYRLNKEKERERVSVEEPDTYYEPLERLKRLESRLQNKDNQAIITDNKLSDVPSMAPVSKEVRRFKQPSMGTVGGCNITNNKMKIKSDRLSPEQPDDPVTSNSKISDISAGTGNEISKPSFVPLNSDGMIAVARTPRRPSVETWRLETDSLNMLMNQVLEQMEKGPVSMTLVARIKAHPFYDSRPMVKELLESIIAAQPPSVQKQASKLIQQQSQELIKRQTAGIAAPMGVTVGIPGRRNSRIYEMAPTPPVKVDDKRISGKYSVGTAHVQHNGQTKNFGERPWHSVEVGFDPDEDVENSVGTPQPFSHNDELTEETVQKSDPIKFTGSRRSVRGSEQCDDEDDEEVEESDSEIDELGKEVEQIEDEENGSYRTAISEENLGDSAENNPPPDPHMKIVAPQFADAFDRGLAKRQSKGKYQHSKVELYGRGVSTECESPTLPHRRIGGPQPTIERSLFLFDKAFFISQSMIVVMTFRVDLAKNREKLATKTGSRCNGFKQSKSEFCSRVCSVPPRSPPNVIKSDDEVSESESDDDEEEDDDENEESDEEESSEGDEANKITSNKQPAESEKRKPQMVELETGDAKYQIKSKPKEDYNKKDATMMIRKTSKPIKLGHRSLAIPSYDAAVAFFRRHNWDRRRRNRTVDVPENILRSIAIHRDEMTLNRHAACHTLATTNDPIGSSRNRIAGTPGRSISPGSRDIRIQVVYGQNSRYNDENFKKTADKERVSPTRLNLGLNHNLYVTRDDKRKSKSVHDLSPDRFDLHVGSTNVSKLVASDPPNISRYDNESSIPQSWAIEPKRFYVYQTRAEREAEKNTSNLHPSSTHRMTGSSWYSGTSTAAHNTEITPSVQNQANHESSNVASHRYRPVGRHVVSVLGDPTRRMYGRSNSMERTAFRQDDLDYFGFRNFLAASELNNGDKGEYSYINFHDTAIRGSTPHEPDHSKLPTRGILKNKQLESSALLDLNLHLVSGIKTKSMTGFRVCFTQTFEQQLSNTENDNRASTEISSTANSQGISGGKDQTSATSGKVSKDELSKVAKKRSLFWHLDDEEQQKCVLGQTVNLRLEGHMESDFKRPSSPIDKIKSLFRKSKDSVPAASQQLSSNYAHLDYTNFPSPASPRYGFADKVYGVYPSSHLTSPITRDPFSPQYRKYTAAVTTPGSTGSNYNRYSYIPATNDRTLRHWHEDPHIY